MAHGWVKLPAREVQWLSRHERHLPTPRIVYSDTFPYGGMYVHPSNEVSMQGGIEIAPSLGTIIVSVAPAMWEPAATLAHEWRHHWQHWNGWEYDGIGWQFTDDYDTEITNYFSRSKSEADALIYQVRRTKDEESADMLNRIRNNTRNRVIRY